MRTCIKRLSARAARWLAPAFVLTAFVCSADTVVNSRHNLSVSGPGDIKATMESDVCVFCHTPHRSNGERPLWNHNMSAVSNYVVYSSTTLDALGLTVPQPNGSSRLCLSCHDGTIALGSVNSRTTPITMQNGVITMPSGRSSNLGTDLSGDHPVSFVYDAALAAKDSQIKDPSALTGKVKLDSEKRLQCTACHDPHNSQFDKFLVMDNTGSALCLQCHNIADWQGSAHAMSTQLAPSTTSAIRAPMPAAAASGAKSLKQNGAMTKGLAKVAPAKSIASEGCANCHETHGAAGKARLLKSAVPEANCFSCHSGGTTGIKNVASDFKKMSSHPITQNSSSHSPTENAVNPTSRHVTCSDCHNPHATASTHSAPGSRMPRTAAPAALADVKGVSATGATVAKVNNEYELCYRCHGDSMGRGASRISRQSPETNKRLQFQTTSSSYHPIEGPGRNGVVPSLLAPWTTSSTMGCIDCHNSDQSPSAGGSGANGPHGSRFTPLLERQLVLTDYAAESPGSYALCYKCHGRESLLSDKSFRATNALGQDRGHRFHIVDQKTACTTCHDSHGVRDQQKLINFNRDYVSRSGNGRLEYVNNGNGSGNCSLSCHGSDHAATSYPNLTSTSLFRAAPKTMSRPRK